MNLDPDSLRSAVTTASSTSDVIRACGGSPSSSSDRSKVKIALEEMGLNIPSRSGRTWSDDDLRAAVADPEVRHLSDVARALGLRSEKSTRAVKRRMKELGLALAPTRLLDRADDSDILASLADARSLGEVLERLHLAKHNSNYAGLRARLRNLGVDPCEVQAERWTPREREPGVPHPFGEARDDALRRSATAMAIDWFLQRGADVSLPVEPTRYDLLVDLHGHFHRIQVKTTTLRDPSGNFRVEITRQGYDATAEASANGRRARVVYDDGEIDWFFIVTGAGTCYLIHVTDTAGQRSLTLGSRYERFRI